MTEDKLDNIGSIIRKQRILKHITLKEMSAITTLSISFLSEIERNVAKPSMSSLRKISQALGISLISFTDASDDIPIDALQTKRFPDMETNRSYISEVKVVRSGFRKKLGYPNRPGYYELLTPDLNRLLEIMYMKLDPGFESGPEPILDPPGEKFGFILKGSLQMTINAETYVLNDGDSIYYPADASVYFKNIGNLPVEAILIVTPPSF